MKKICLCLSIIALLLGCSGGASNTSSTKQVDAAPNTLTDQEKADGWVLLFDGKTTNGWRGVLKETFPDHGWVITDGAFEILPKNEGGGGGDIVTVDQFDNFDFVFDFKMTEGANSGVKYYVTENVYDKGALGLEYQVLDDKVHPDAEMGRDGNRKLASLYDLIPADQNKKFNGIGEWNTGRIVAKNNHVEHWLNGFKVLEYERGSAEYRKLVSESKYSNMKNFGEAPEGYILLQEHNDRVWYRNIKIRKL